MKKAKQVKFYLEKRKNTSTGELIVHNVPINLYFTFGKGRFQYYTGFRIDAQFWDKDKMRVKRNHPDASEINISLEKLDIIVTEAYQKARLLNIRLDKQYFKSQLLSPDDSYGNHKKSLSECLELYLESSKLTKRARTIVHMTGHLNRVAEFCQHNHIAFSFENIDMNFYERFLRYCFDVKNYKNNYTGTIIKTLKAFLNWCTEKGYNTNLEFRKKAFKKLQEEPEIIFLTFDELDHFYNYEFTSKKLSDVRDVFCFGCFTGMRFSDIAALSPENIHEDRIIYRIAKTDKNNTIPLNPFTRELLIKHEGRPTKCLPVISEQNTNQYLKEAIQKAGIDRKVEIIHYQGAKRIKEVRPINEIITFHVSKKTFMTNFLARGGSLLTAMSITGNKDLKTARRYYKVVDKLKDEEMKRVFGGK